MVGAEKRTKKTENQNIVFWWCHFGRHFQKLAPGPKIFQNFILATQEWLSSIQHDQNRGISRKLFINTKITGFLSHFVCRQKVA